MIGTGTVKRDGGNAVDLRELDVSTASEALVLLKSTDPVERAKGAWALGELGNTEMISRLQEALNDSVLAARRSPLQKI